MKKLSLLFIIIGFYTTAWTQMDGVKRDYKLRHEVGFNATQLISNMFSQNIGNVGPFSFIYKFHPSPKGAIRLGFGGSFLDNKQIINITEERNNNILEANARLGYEFRKALDTNWRTLFGVDAIAAYDERTTVFESSFDVVTTSSNETRYGASPFFGIEFKINQHIRISTEFAFSYVIIENEQVDIFQEFPEFNETRRNNDTAFRIESPGFIYLTVRL